MFLYPYLLIIILFSIECFTSEKNLEPEKLQIHLIAGTQKKNPKPGRYDRLGVEISNVPIGEIQPLLVKLAPLMAPYESGSHQVSFYLSRKRSPLQNEYLIKRTIEQFEQTYPGVHFQARIHFLEDPVRNLEEAAIQIEKALCDSEALKELDGKWRSAINALTLTNQKILEEILQRADSPGWTQKLRSPAHVAKLIHRLAWVKASVNFLTRAGQVGGGDYSGVGPVLSGSALLLADPAIEYYATKLEVEIGRAFTQHGLPIPTENHPLLKKWDEIYRHAYSAQFIKGTVASTLVWGIGRPALLQQLGHWNNPTVIPQVSLEDVAEMGLAGLITSILYFGGFQGFEGLRQKQWMNHTAMELWLRLGGALWQGMEILFSMGTPQAKALLPIFVVPLWSLYLSAWGLDFILPARQRPFVVIDPILDHRTEIDQLEATEATRRFDFPLGDLKEIEQLATYKSYMTIVKDKCARFLTFRNT